jgi:hypothetical protein
LSSHKRRGPATFETETILVSRLIVIILFAALVLQISFKVILFLNYEVNKEHITLKYCENKDKPKMKCHGKCHLNKQIKEQDKHTNQDKGLIKEVNEMPGDTKNESRISFYLHTDNYIPNFLYLLRKTSLNSNPLFRPPTL